MVHLLPPPAHAATQHPAYGIAASAAISRVNLITLNKFPSGRWRRLRKMNEDRFLLLFYLDDGVGGEGIGGGRKKWLHSADWDL
jgi:hypothetical protein